MFAKNLSFQSVQPTPPSRSASLKRRSHKRDSSNASAIAKANGASSASASASTAPNVSSSGSSHDTSNTEGDDLVYIVNKHTISRRVPMDVETELVPFDALPKEAQSRPTETLTWARQTPEFLYLETIVPPQCKVCLARLEERARVGSVQSAIPVVVQAPAVVQAPVNLQSQSFMQAPVREQVQPIVQAPVRALTPTLVAAPTLMPAPATSTPLPYDEGNTPFWDTFEEVPGGDKAIRSQYLAGNASNLPTPALPVPGKYLWST